jgi:hypothetical protein
MTDFLQGIEDFVLSNYVLKTIFGFNTRMTQKKDSFINDTARMITPRRMRQA